MPRIPSCTDPAVPYAAIFRNQLPRICDDWDPREVVDRVRFLCLVARERGMLPDWFEPAHELLDESRTLAARTRVRVSFRDAAGAAECARQSASCAIRYLDEFGIESL